VTGWGGDAVGCPGHGGGGLFDGGHWDVGWWFGWKGL
jgi:hypothetical protein